MLIQVDNVLALQNSSVGYVCAHCCSNFARIRANSTLLLFEQNLARSSLTVVALLQFSSMQDMALSYLMGNRGRADAKRSRVRTLSPFDGPDDTHTLESCQISWAQPMGHHGAPSGTQTLTEGRRASSGGGIR